MRGILIVFAVAVLTLSAGWMAVRYLIRAPYYSAHFRHTTQTQITLRFLFAAVSAYHAEYHEFPKGGNAEVLRQLLGENPNRTIFLSELVPYNPSSWPPVLSVDQQSRVVDGWGRPVRFRPGPINCVDSAGADGVIGTPDDIVEPMAGDESSSRR